MPIEKQGGNIQDNSRSALPASSRPKSWQEARDQLENLKRGIDEQIRNYPPPIPACDAQFNYLLEERGRLAEALGSLDVIRAGKLNEDEASAALEAFLGSSDYFG